MRGSFRFTMEVLYLLAVIVASCSARHKHQTRITHGQDANRGEFPYQVSLQRGAGNNWTHTCGASIITEDVVVTAGHCVNQPLTWGWYRVVAGILNLDDTVNTRQNITVHMITIHPNYTRWSTLNDIAVIKLLQKLKWNGAVQKIGLPKAGAIFTGPANLTGWGSTSTGDSLVMPNHLQTAPVIVLTQKECVADLNKLRNSNNITSPYDGKSNICSGPINNGVSACSNDSGSPLAKTNLLVGIVSWVVVPCGTKGAPTVYTNVANFVDFINDNL